MKKTFAVLLIQIFIQRTYLVSNLCWPRLTVFTHLFIKIEFGSQSIFELDVHNVL